MASYLLDTVAFLWIVQGSSKLPERVAATLVTDGALCHLSHVSLIEMAIKHRNGKMPLPAPPHEIIATECPLRGIELLPLTPEAIFLLETLPQHHNDPFDRLLACQAATHDMTLVTPDRILRKYKIKTLW